MYFKTGRTNYPQRERVPNPAGFIFCIMIEKGRFFKEFMESNQLDDSHFSCVAAARAYFYDPAIATVYICVFRGDFVE